MQKKWIRLADNPKAWKAFRELYGDKEQEIKNQIMRYEGLINTYKEYFPEDEGDIQLFSTPGRTEIGGNHTDHNAGRVLAASVNFDTIAAVTASDDNQIVIYSEGYSHPFRVNLSHLEPVSDERETTTALIRGTAARFRELGYSIGGFHAYISSSVAIGSGLSSSASIEVLLGTILNALYNKNELEPDLLAKIGQYAENVYFGKPCGLMDQMACAIGGFIAIDFQDSERVEYRKIEFDPAEYGFHVLVMDTGGSHEDLTQDYADIYQEMKSIAQTLGKNVLRELSLEDIINNIPRLRKEAGDRAILRAMHFFLEDQRVVGQAKALEENRFADFLQLVRESGSSSWRFLQNCCSSHNPNEQGLSLALALTENFLRRIGVGACRVHGGGFAGTIQVYLPNEYMEEYCRSMERIFGKNAVTILNIRSKGTLHLNPLLD